MSPQVRNLCYMVTRRERTKHTICKLQEQIFHLQMKLIEQDLCRGRHSAPCWEGVSLGPGRARSPSLSLLTDIIIIIRSIWEPVKALAMLIARVWTMAFSSLFPWGHHWCPGIAQFCQRWLSLHKDRCRPTIFVALLGSRQAGAGQPMPPSPSNPPLRTTNPDIHK